MKQARKKDTKIIPFHSAQTATYNAAAEQKENVIGRRIVEARRRRGISLAELSDLLALHGVRISRAGISKWEQRGAVSGYQLIALCRVLDIEDGLDFFSKEVRPPVLDEAGMAKLEEYRDDLIASGRYRPRRAAENAIEYVDKPVSCLTASAGTGAFLDEGSFETVSFPRNSVPDGAEFGIRVSGDSMEPVYHDGQIVWVQRSDTLTPGEVGIFIYDGEGYIKVYGEREPESETAEELTDSYGDVRPQPVMLSYNKKYPPKAVEPHLEFQIVGRVL